MKKVGGFLLGLEHANPLQGVRSPQEAPPLAGLSFIFATIYPALRTGPCLASLGGGASTIVRVVRLCSRRAARVALAAGSEKGRCPSLRTPRNICTIWNMFCLLLAQRYQCGAGAALRSRAMLDAPH